MRIFDIQLIGLKIGEESGGEFSSDTSTIYVKIVVETDGMEEMEEESVEKWVQERFKKDMYKGD